MPTGNFLILYHPPRERFAETITADESDAVRRHFRYLAGAAEDGRLFLAGRTEDATLGVSLLNAESEAEARAFIEADPGVTGGVFRVEIKAWRTAVCAVGE
jgi:uncharacterized protein YciI